MATGIETFRHVIALWPSKEALAADLGVKGYTVAKWATRDSIPAEYWQSILRTEVARESRLTCDVLAMIAAREVNA